MPLTLPNTLPVRLVWCAAGMAITYYFQTRLDGRPSVSTITDALHEATASFNAALVATPALFDWLVIASSLLVDLSAAAFVLPTVFSRTASLRSLVALSILVLLRQVSQELIVLPHPPGFIWRHPGVPALSVSYVPANDFFFSGHTAVPLLAALELGKQGRPLLSAFCAVTSLVMVGLVVVTRIHYSADIIAGVLAAYTASQLAEQLMKPAKAKEI